MMTKPVSLCLLALLVVLGAAVACTSSTTTTSTNPRYDQDYTQTTRSRQTSSQQTEGYPEEVYHPPVTLSMVAMTTGEVLVGEPYPVIAVVDNPEKRDLTYRWAVEAGELKPLPEKLRSEVLSFEAKLREAKGVPGAAALAAAPAAGEGAAATGTPAVSPPSAPSAGAASPASTSVSATAPSAGAAGSASGEPPTPPQKPAAPAEESPAKPESQPPAVTTSWGASKPVQTALSYLRYAALAPEDESADADGELAEEDWPEPVPAEEADGIYKEHPEQEKASDEEASADAGGEAAAEEQETAAAAEEAAEAASMVDEVSEEAAGFQPKVGEGRLVEVQPETESTEAGEGEGGEAETDFLEEEPPLVMLETETPYVLWTPDATGAYTIRCTVLDSKGNELTPERSFPVTVTEPRPKTELVWNTTQKLREDDYLVVELRAKNLPAYNKGLFTVNFDPTKLSFRLVETGSFFPEGYRTSLYYAQPPNNSGRVTLAVGAEEVGLQKGDGVLARIIFKVKETIEDPSTLAITETMDEEARYILDAEGTNILPPATGQTLFATDWVEPPPPPQRTRTEAATGESLPATPAPPSTDRRGQLQESRSTTGGQQPATTQGAQTIAPGTAAGRTGTGAPATGGTGGAPPRVMPGEAAQTARNWPPPPQGLTEVERLEWEIGQITNDATIPDEEKASMIAQRQQWIADLRAAESGGSGEGGGADTSARTG